MNPEFAKIVSSCFLGDSITRCYQCGICTGICPSSEFTALRTREAIHKACLGIKEILSSEELWLCTMCHSCYEYCRFGVDVSDIIVTLRNLASEEGYAPKRFINVGKTFFNTAFAFPISRYTEKMRGQLGLNKLIVSKSTIEEAQKIASITNFYKILEGKK